MTFPPLPKNNRNSTPPPPKDPGFGPSEPSPDARLTEEETTYILKQHLRPSQFDDPVLIRFILSYVVCRSTTQAAREVGLQPGRGQQLRQRPEIHAAIEALTAKAVMKYGYDATEVMERVKEIAAIDPVEFENPDGSYKTHLSQINPESRRAIKKFKVKNIFGQDANGIRTVIGQLIEVELWDKLKAVEMLGSEKELFKKVTRHEHDVTENMASILLGSARRAEERVIEASTPQPQLTGNIQDASFTETTGGEGGADL